MMAQLPSSVGLGASTQLLWLLLHSWLSLPTSEDRLRAAPHGVSHLQGGGPLLRNTFSHEGSDTLLGRTKGIVPALQSTYLSLDSMSQGRHPFCGYLSLSDQCYLRHLDSATTCLPSATWPQLPDTGLGQRQ